MHGLFHVFAGRQLKVAMEKKRIGVVYLTDGNRDDLTYLSVMALGLNHARPIDIHIVQAGFAGDPPATLLEALQLRGHRLATHFLKATDRGLEGYGHITATAYAKVEALSAVSEDYEILCYLDNDTLAVRAIDFGTAAPRTQPLAAAPDLSVSTGLDYSSFFDNCAKHGLQPRYFNSGLLAVNVMRWKESRIAEKYEIQLKAHANFCPYRNGSCIDLDQCALNLALQGAWEALPIQWNVQKSAFQTPLWEQAVIRHYTGSEKFLPMRAHRADKLERIVFERIKRACPELKVEVPRAYLGLPYWLNGLRRTGARRRISRLIEQNLPPPS